MIVLGIDPGTRITGYGCVRLTPGSVEPSLVEAGVLTFKGGDSLESRLAELHASLAEAVKLRIGPGAPGAPGTPGAAHRSDRPRETPAARRRAG